MVVCGGVRLVVCWFDSFWVKFWIVFWMFGWNVLSCWNFIWRWWRWLICCVVVGCWGWWCCGWGVGGECSGRCCCFVFWIIGIIGVLRCVGGWWVCLDLGVVFVGIVWLDVLCVGVDCSYRVWLVVFLIFCWCVVVLVWVGWLVFFVMFCFCLLLFMVVVFWCIFVVLVGLVGDCWCSLVRVCWRFVGWVVGVGIFFCGRDGMRCVWWVCGEWFCSCLWSLLVLFFLVLVLCCFYFGVVVYGCCVGWLGSSGGCCYDWYGWFGGWCVLCWCGFVLILDCWGFVVRYCWWIVFGLVWVVIWSVCRFGVMFGFRFWSCCVWKIGYVLGIFWW